MIRIDILYYGRYLCPCLLCRLSENGRKKYCFLVNDVTGCGVDIRLIKSVINK